MDIAKDIHECLNPIYIKDLRMFVNCGKCEYCHKIWVNDWATRLQVQKQLSYLTIPMTLTYDDEHLPYINGVPSLCKEDVQKFFKRLRKYLNTYYKDVSIQYFISGEYGSTFLRPHYHLILFVNTLNNTYTKYDFQTACLQRWKKGFIQFMGTDNLSIRYLAKYIGKTTGISDYAHQHGVPLPFVLCSRRPAIGAKYLELDGVFERHFKGLTDPTKHKICLPNMGSLNIPRYIRRKVWQNLPANYKRSFWQKFNDEKNAKREQDCESLIRRLRIPSEDSRRNFIYLPDVQERRKQQEMKQNGEYIAMCNYLKFKNK